MLLFPLALVCGVTVGYIRRGRLGALEHVQFRARALVVVALALQAVLGQTPDDLRVAQLAVSYALVCLWLVLNLRFHRKSLRLGLALVAAGWLLNSAAIASFKGMPVSLDALRQVGGATTFTVESGNLSKHVPVASPDRRAWLGDVIPLSPLGSVISLGDVAMFGGIIVVIAAGMRRPGDVAAGEVVGARV